MISSGTRSPAASESVSPLVTVSDLRVSFEGRDETVYAVNGVDFELRRGEVLGIVGESGSGKSVTLRALMRLLPRHYTRISGRVSIDGHDMFRLSDREIALVRGRTVAMIFQEPMIAFDPVFTIGDQIAETIIRHEQVSRKEALTRAKALLEHVKIPSATQRLKAYPHELSGGMSQRAMIALALSCRPSVLLADEPTTALDATVQIQILLLLRQLQQEFGMAMIFVTHDVGVAIEVSDRLAVMYAGRFVESGPVGTVIGAHWHPYTEGLLASTVHGAMPKQRLETIPGSPPNLTEPPSHCSFAPRCRYAESLCFAEIPRGTRLGENHMASCFMVEQRVGQGRALGDVWPEETGNTRPES